MHILVYDVAASSSGALSVLEDLYHDIDSNQDKSVQWTFVISTPKLKETENIHIIRKPWIKKSWLHRLVFEFFGIQRVIRKVKPDKVFSMQNLAVPRCKLPQILYVHLALVFSDYKYSIKENKTVWIYQNIMNHWVYHSIRKADKTIVQTEWMKEFCVNCTKVSSEKITVIQPNIAIGDLERFENIPENLKRFIYPATPLKYKNHMLILQACKKLQEEGVQDYEVLFTFNKYDGVCAKHLYDYAQENNLNVKFIGSQSRNVIFELYTKAVLIFPSFVESYGLPLLEARMSGAPVLAGDMPFSREILKGYKNMRLNAVSDSESLYSNMKDCIMGTFEYAEDVETVVIKSESLSTEIIKYS